MKSSDLAHIRSNASGDCLKRWTDAPPAPAHPRKTIEPMPPKEKKQRAKRFTGPKSQAKRRKLAKMRPAWANATIYNKTHLVLEMALPPLLNTAYSPNGHGGIRLSDEARNYKDTVSTELLCKGVRPMAGPLNVSIVIFRPLKQKGDIDAYSKVLLDSLNKVAWLDDSQIKKKSLRIKEHSESYASVIVVPMEAA